ncbi:D-alanyl-D-alanine carboxypeptidase [Arthrobacter sp. cf158]|uniref:serine hydrolase domain-containing protein n=1 Tax=Arthrobacter sp. cf158 TaxID=1761744 RepID=UPI000899D1AD|nr:serine hydrolase domain-containing protein [Arthrobacter sp. cf158]SDW04313.1 D-alanyl-D-alanine carboxypeptidase [Arthrobacter sp. cf158]
MLAVAALAGCTALDPAPLPPSIEADAMASLDYAMQEFMDQDALAVLAQVRWPGGEWSKAYGVRDLETKQPAQPGDRVPVASVTKTMTAVSVLKLVDDGLIALDDPVNGLLESFGVGLKPPGPITVRQLLDHTSGMPSYGDALFRSMDDLVSASNQRLTPLQGLKIASTLPWDERTVGLFHYSDSNYLALGLILERFRGKGYPQILRDDIINPLGLTHTTIDQELSDAPDLITGYITIRGKRVTGSPTLEQLGSPSHGVVSTMSDINDFMAALFGGRLVSATALAQMQKAVIGPFASGMFKWSPDCSGAPRFFARGGFLDFRTIALSSADGRYQATMTLAPAPLPSPQENPDMQDERDLMSSQILSALMEAQDRLCR